MLRKTITALAMTAMAVLFAAGTAQADTTVRTKAPSAGAGRATWTENGDMLEVCDLKADSKGTRAYIYVPEDRDTENGRVLIKVEDPRSPAYDGCVTATKNISETGPLAIKVCLYSGATLSACNYSIIRLR